MTTGARPATCDCTEAGSRAVIVGMLAAYPARHSLTWAGIEPVLRGDYASQPASVADGTGTLRGLIQDGPHSA